MTPDGQFPYADADLARFRDLQRLAYDCAVRPDHAYWLDDDLPHVRRWAANGRAA